MKFKEFLEALDTPQAPPTKSAPIQWGNKGGNRWIGVFFVPDLDGRADVRRTPDATDTRPSRGWIKYQFRAETTFIDKEKLEASYGRVNVQGKGALVANVSVPRFTDQGPSFEATGEDPVPDAYWDKVAGGIKELMQAGANIIGVTFTGEQHMMDDLDELTQRLGFKVAQPKSGGLPLLVHPNISKGPGWFERMGGMFATETTLDQNKMLQLHNQQRAQMQAQPLVLDNLLIKASQKYAATMNKLGGMGHLVGGTDPATRARRAGFAGSVGENVLRGAHSEQQALGGWMDSPGHKANLLHPGWTKAGFGRVGECWVAMFGVTRDGGASQYRVAFQGKVTDPRQMPQQI